MQIVPEGPVLAIVRLPHSEGLPLPSYETAGAAGMDLRAAVPEDRPLILLPGKRTLVPTGLVFEIPQGFEGQVRPRSGLALKHGITCLNTPGTIDSDYRGELKVLLVNLGDEDFEITRGMRVAQLVVAAVTRAEIAERAEAAATARGAGGFGSTGTA
jgi:dUTP pyrophosphatase